MSIQNPENEFPESSLITRLVAEIYSEYSQAGTPSAFDLSSKVPGASGKNAAGDNGLAGAYPAQTQPYAPPIHPASQEAATGTHEPGSTDAFQFGEPKLESALPEKQKRVTPSALVREPDLEILDYYFIKDSSPRAIEKNSEKTVFNVEAVRKDFPALHQQVNGRPLVWFDNAATTQKPQAVIDAIAHFYENDNSNIHRGAHALAKRATDLYEGGRQKVQQFLGATDASEIIFVRGTTEAINLVANTYGSKNIGAGDEIILTTMEHHANIVPWQLLAERTGAVIRVAPINDAGELDLGAFASLLNSKTKLVSVTQVANALGTVNPVEQIIAMAHSHGVPVLVDGAQSTPHMPVNVSAMNADFFTFSGHKIFGPTGIGVLYGKKSLLETLPPWQGGGNMIKNVTFSKTTFEGVPQKFEAGTPNIAGVVGLGAAVDYLMKVGLPSIAAYEHDLLEYATKGLGTIKGLELIGTAKAKASVLSFVLDGFSTLEVGQHLDRCGIAVRSGHHCAQPSLRRFGLESTVRPSLAFYNTPQEVDILVRALQLLIQQKAK